MNKPDFKYEQGMWDRGFKVVAGADEVGRGCFAGPVTAGCVVFSNNMQIPEEIKIDDSKKLDQKKRKQTSVWIKNNCLAWGVGYASVSEINSLGIKKAADRAYRRAIYSINKGLLNSIDFLLVDAFFIPYIRGLSIRDKKIKDMADHGFRQMAIKKGDGLSVSIAAASIIAKVERDEFMIKLSENKSYKIYEWQKNKGYASLQHRTAIIEHGTTTHHRKQFVETFLKNREKQ